MWGDTMSVDELTPDQLEQLKKSLLAEQIEEVTGTMPKCIMVNSIDDFISDSEVFDRYDGILFTPDDFE